MGKAASEVVGDSSFACVRVEENGIKKLISLHRHNG
jgi:hypothetical protein